MAQVHLYLVLSIATIMVCMSAYSEACFITNCPPGGKRSAMTSLTPNHLPAFRRECTRCGPALSGRCYGPNICCSPLSGCSIGGAASARCALEAYSPQLCINPGPSCANGKGVCAVGSTCCTSDGCFTDKNCTSPGEMLGQDFAL